ncbi:MAG: heparinase II/III family protein [Thermotogae bacterium]|nr:heparinase II/III family protein [Thermotogota bacterium]
MYIGMANEEQIIKTIKLYEEKEWFKKIINKMYNDLEKLLNTRVIVPKERGKAFHDTCPYDNTPLVFDPFDPSNRKCIKCGRNYRDYEYYLSWVRQFHFWLSEKVVEAGILYSILKDDRYLDLIRDVLYQYSSLYLWYPHQDNELGPGRIFPSTYMESLWIANLVIGLDFIAPNLDTQFLNMVKNKLFYPAVYIIMDYDEGMNNRQAMNNFGIGAVGFSFENKEFINHSLRGPHGLLVQLKNGVLNDGMWYEGNNYHWPTLEAFVLLAEVANSNGFKIYEGEYGEILKRMFHSPLDSIMPDGIFPSRKDSQYLKSVGEQSSLYEIAYTRFKEERFGKFLKKVYSDEKNRSDNKWYALFAMSKDLPEEKLNENFSILMPGTGLAIFRKDKLYTYLDYGFHGGGHGHPDKLHFTFMLNNTRFFEDLGTCNYLFRELFWYRSTRSHNTVVVDGKAQNLFTTGKLIFYGDMDEFNVACAQVDPGTAYPDSGFKRTLILTKNYVVDMVECFSKTEKDFDLNWNTSAEIDFEEKLVWEKTSELVDKDGGEFIKNIYVCKPQRTLHVNLKEKNEQQLKMIMVNQDQLFKAETPGRPGNSESGRILIQRKSGKRVIFWNVIYWDSNVEILENDDQNIGLVINDSEKHYISITPDEDLPSFSLIKEIKGKRMFFGYNITPPKDCEIVQLRNNEIPIIKTIYRGVKNNIHISKSENLILPKHIIQQPDGGITVEDESKASKTLAVATLELGGMERNIIPKYEKITIIRNKERRSMLLDIRDPLKILSFVPNLSGNVFRVEVQNVSPYTLKGEMEIRANFGKLNEKVLIESCSTFKKDYEIENLSMLNDWLKASTIVKIEKSRFLNLKNVRVGKALKVNMPPSLDGSWSGWCLEKPITLASKNQVRHGEKEWFGPRDLSAVCFVNFDEKNIYIGLSVTDDYLVLYGRWRAIRYFPDDKRHKMERLYDSDSFQVYFDFRKDEEQKSSHFTPGAFGFLFAPRIGTNILEKVEVCSEWTDLTKVEGTWYPTDKGYDAFVKIPFEILKIENPKIGDKVGFDLILNDNDGTERRNQQMVWSGSRNGRVWLHQQYHYPDVFGYLFFENKR